MGYMPMSTCHCRSQKNPIPGAGVTVGCEHPDMDTWNLTWKRQAFYKDTVYFLLFSTREGGWKHKHDLRFNSCSLSSVVVGVPLPRPLFSDMVF